MTPVDFISDRDGFRAWAGVACAAAAIPPSDHAAALHPSERDAIGSASPRRVASFSSGRLCARRALGELGLHDVGLPRTPGGAVRWPAGIRGSISHTRDVVVAIVSADPTVLGIGIDVELVERMNERVHELVLSEREQERERCEPGRRALSDQDRIARFSLKEAVFKCLHPLTGHWFGFEAASVDPSGAARGMTPTIVLEDAALLDALERGGHGNAVLEARLLRTATHVMSLVLLRPAVPPDPAQGT